MELRWKFTLFNDKYSILNILYISAYFIIRISLLNFTKVRNLNKSQQNNATDILYIRVYLISQQNSWSTIYWYSVTP